MSASLVGSEMCIRDRPQARGFERAARDLGHARQEARGPGLRPPGNKQGLQKRPVLALGDGFPESTRA
eukprot:2958004-Alexandrium_andersonii.AAC.1